MICFILDQWKEEIIATFKVLEIRHLGMNINSYNRLCLYSKTFTKSTEMSLSDNPAVLFV